MPCERRCPPRASAQPEQTQADAGASAQSSAQSSASCLPPAVWRANSAHTPTPSSAVSALRRRPAPLGRAARRTKVTGTELEKKIAEACSNKPWGASSTMLAEIAQSTYD